jgi:transposase
MVWLKKGNNYLVNFSVQNLKKLYNSEKNAKSKLRLLAAIQRKEGKTLDDIAYSLQKPKTTIHDWLKRINSKTLEGLYDIKQKGNRTKLTSQQIKKLEKILDENPQKQGIPFKLWTTTLVQYIIYNHFQISYSQSGIWKLVKKLNFSLKVPGPENIKANKKAKELFKKELKKKFNLILNLDSRSSVLTKHISNSNNT